MVYQLNYRPECVEVAILASKVASILKVSEPFGDETGRF